MAEHSSYGASPQLEAWLRRLLPLCLSLTVGGVAAALSDDRDLGVKVAAFVHSALQPLCRRRGTPGHLSPTVQTERPRRDCR